MIKYICDRCNNNQAVNGETDKPMHSIRYIEKTLHLCKKCRQDFVTLQMTPSDIYKHLHQNCIKQTKPPF